MFLLGYVPIKSKIRLSDFETAFIQSIANLFCMNTMLSGSRASILASRLNAWLFSVWFADFCGYFQIPGEVIVRRSSEMSSFTEALKSMEESMHTQLLAMRQKLSEDMEKGRSGCSDLAKAISNAKVRHLMGIK